MSNQVVIGVVAYGLAINLVACAAMVLDKANARNGTRRIPKATLLNLAILGGSVETVIAQQTMRHKTRKEPFRSKLIGILVLQIVVLMAVTVALVVAGSPEALWRCLTSGDPWRSLGMRASGSRPPIDEATAWKSGQAKAIMGCEPMTKRTRIALEGR